ncbi:hypothetical protein U9W26_001592 [Staphylococcus pseudintermedius]|nr:hypothetical protein [Staphylococcus pseudintermedius]EMC0283584.1 hypothetical protein [Staphylococcus pseudintermedius]
MSTRIRNVVNKNFKNGKATLLRTINGEEYPNIDIASENSEFIILYPIKGVTEKRTLVYIRDIKKLEAIERREKT